MFKNLKIKSKIMLAASILFILMMGISSFISSNMSFGLIYDRIKNSEAPANVSYIAEQFDKKIEKTISLAKLTADNPFLHHWISSGETDEFKNESLSYLKKVKDEGLSFVFMVSDKTKNYYTDEGLFKTVSASSQRDSWFFDTMEAGKKVSINIEPSEKNDDLMAFINVIMGNVNNPYGVAGAGINLNELSAELKNSKLSKNSISYLIGDNGGIKAHPDQKYITQVKNIKKIDNGNFQEKVTNTILGNSSGSVEYTDKNGVEKLAVFTEVKSAGWKIVTETPINELGKGLGKIKAVSFTMLAVFICILVFVLNIIMNIILRPVRATVSTLADISEGHGDLTKRIEVKSNDEAGILSSNFNKFAAKLQDMIKKVAENTTLVKDASDNLSSISSRLAKNSENSSEKSENAASSAEEMSSNIKSIASGMDTATDNVGSVASATEEMSSTIDEIAKNSDYASNITKDAVSVAKEASDQISRLGDASVDIAKVIETINDISDQTNLLALNATIEAARAGEAGKGFAVVANEIKELAGQTNHATEEIKQKIEGVQSSTSTAVSGIEKLSDIINSVNETVAGIAAAVEEQSATTREMSENISNASSGLNDVNENISQIASVSETIAGDVSELNASSQEISENSKEVLKSSDDLKKFSESLKELVDQFKI